MRLLVCGGRDFRDRARLWDRLDEIDIEHCIDLVIGGKAKGADELGVAWAICRGCAYWEFPARWDDIDRPGARVATSPSGRRYDADAGPLRNQRMIDEGFPTHGLATPGGNGTADMVRRLRRAEIPIFDL